MAPELPLCLIPFLPFPSGLQVILPEYLQEHFVQAALSYIACNSEGEFICKDNDCWCQCGPKFPECNCPYMDIQAMEENLVRISETWNTYNSEFEESGEIFMGFFPLFGCVSWNGLGFNWPHPCCLYNSLVPHWMFLNSSRFVPYIISTCPDHQDFQSHREWELQVKSASEQLFSQPACSVLPGTAV